MRPSVILQSRMSRRTFAKTLTVVGIAGSGRAAPAPRASAEELARIAGQPVLDVSFLKQPGKVASVELLRNGRVFLVRVRSTDGVEAITVPNPTFGWGTKPRGSLFPRPPGLL